MINNVVLVGRLTRDPELKFTPNGAAVATFTLAVNRNFTNQSGQRKLTSSIVSFGANQPKPLPITPRKGRSSA